MPKIGTYRANSVIYFQGDAADKIFVLQGGKVVLNYSNIETGKAIREVIQTGEFFGVKSALGHYPREENAVVLEDASVLIFTVAEFEAFSLKNTRIILKMLKVFSNQLRHIHKQVESLMDNPTTVNTEMGLYKTGEYYLKNRMYAQAKYVLGRYLTYYPAGKVAEQASKYLETAEAALARYGSSVPKDSPIMSPGENTRACPPSAQEHEPKEELTDVAKQYYNAVSLLSNDDFQGAAKSFSVIIKENANPEYVAKSQFDIAKCFMGLKQWDLTIKHLSTVIQSNPTHQDMADMLYIIGDAWHKKGDSAKAIAFFNKVISMPGDDDSSARIKAKKALNTLKGA